MYNEINKEEKLTKEERDILERNLKVCFETIFKDPDTKSFDMKDIENKERFLEKFSPWHQKKGKGQELIQKFVDIVNNDQSTEDFSWLDILNNDKRWNKDDELKKEIKENKNKYINMHYQIPTHFHGDIDNAVLFYCMENPRGYTKDSDMDTWAEKQMFGKKTVDNYYKYTAKLRDETWKNETSQKIIKERYNLNGFTTDSIEKIIYSNSKDETPLRRELDNMFKENKEFFDKKYILVKNKRSKKPALSDKYYYISRFYAQLLEINGENLSKYNIKSEYKEEAKAERDKAIKISEKICNVEIYPFSSSDPKLKGIGGKILRNSDLSRLGAYIVLRRIYKYLQEVEKGKKDAQKPVIIFRKYDSAWKELFKKIFDEVKDFNNKLVLELLEKGFFYCQLAQQGGGITSGNVISVPNYKILLSMKKDAFKEISDLLPRIDIDKISAKESGNE